MVKYLRTTILIALILLISYSFVYAEDSKTPPLLIDEINALDEYDFDVINEKLIKVSERIGADVVIVLVDGIGNKTPMEFADDYFDYNGYGQGKEREGVLLLISMAERDWYISTCGPNTIEKLDDDKIQSLGETMIDNGLSDLDFSSALSAYIKKVNRYVGGNFVSFFDGFIALVVSSVLGFFKIKKTKKSYSGAGAVKKFDFVKNGVSHIESPIDSFIREYTTSVVESSSSSGSSTHTSSSGTTHGGGGGKF